MRRTIVRYGFRQARRHPRAVLKVTTAAALHPRSRRMMMQFARSSPADRRIISDVLEALQAQRASARKARRRARVRKLAIGASVVGASVGVAAVAGRNLRSAA